MKDGRERTIARLVLSHFFWIKTAGYLPQPPPPLFLSTDYTDYSDYFASAAWQSTNYTDFYLAMTEGYFAGTLIVSPRLGRVYKPRISRIFAKKNLINCELIRLHSPQVFAN